MDDTLGSNNQDATPFVIDAQGNVGIGTATMHSSALLHLNSITKGLLPPSMTTAQRDSIVSPAAGLVIYNLSTSQLEVFNGTEWTLASTTCPASYADAGNYCIETAERVAADWATAARTCRSAGGQLCTAAQWASACYDVPGLTGTTGNWEWLAESPGIGEWYGGGGTNYSASVIGNSDCPSMSEALQSTSNNYRCCSTK